LVILYKLTKPQKTILNRAIQKYIEDPVSEEILSGNVQEGQTIKVSYSKTKNKILIKVD
jgi:ATP-dependent Clp protease ATP-binding subunit ClpC